MLLLFVALVGCAKKEPEVPLAVWESDGDAAVHIRCTLYSKRSAIEYAQIHLDVVTLVRGML
jgi:hypothetical protein